MRRELANIGPIVFPPLVTEAASSVFGTEERDGFVCQRIKSRKEVGRLDTKAKFFPKLENV